MIKRASRASHQRMLDTLTCGFIADPFLRYLFPEPSQFLKVFPRILNLFGGGAFEHDTAFHAQDHGSAALWLGPGVHPDEDGLTNLFEEHFSGAMLDELFSNFEQMDAFHPDEPCWHLAFIAVDPAHQGKGRGTAMLEHTLQIIDAEGGLCYLESTNPANISLYQRYDFELIGEIQAGNSPSMWPMRREARRP